MRAIRILLAAGLSFAALSASAAEGTQWIGSWATAAQPALPGKAETFHDQSLRLIVHSSAGGTRVRVRLSNTYGKRPLTIGTAHIAYRAADADIDPASDRILRFHGSAAVTIAPGSSVTSDPADLTVPAPSDLAISLYLPKASSASTSHLLAMQTSYVATAAGDNTAAAHFPPARSIDSWPFLTGVEDAAQSGASTVVVLGDSFVDGDGSTPDTNHRLPDLLAARLQQAGGSAQEIGVLNEGLIGNRLLRDSPRLAAKQYGKALGQSVVARFQRDVLEQAGVGTLLLRTGTNDIALPGCIATPAEQVSAGELIAGYRRLVARARSHGLRVVGFTLPPFENAEGPGPGYYTLPKEALRQQVNTWIRDGGGFDTVVDLDRILRDPDHPARLLPRYDSGDHLHPNDEGYAAVADAIPLDALRPR